MDLRLEQREDHDAVRRLHLTAFGDHGRVVTRLIDELRQSVTPVDGLSLVAEEAGEVVGHVMFTRSLLDAPRQLVDVQVLSPLAVRPERQRQGIGSALTRRGLHVLAERGVPVVFLEATPTITRGWASGRRRAGLPTTVAADPRRRLPGDHAARVPALDDRHPGLLRGLLAPRRRRPARPRPLTVPPADRLTARPSEVFENNRLEEDAKC